MTNISFDLDDESFVTLHVGIQSPYTFPSHTLFINQPSGKLNNMVIWDGRDGAGNLVGPSSYIAAIDKSIMTMPDNSVVIKTAAPVLVSLTTDPYVIYPLHGDSTKIEYQVSTNAFVTLRVEDPAGAVINTLVNYELKPPGTHSVTWFGKDSMSRTINSEGHYKVRITLTDPATNVQTTRVVNVTVFK